MKYLVALFILLMPIPLLSMDKNSYSNACMVYSGNPAMGNSYALVQGGLMAASIMMNHPKVSPALDLITKNARKSAFIAPALIAYNSGDIKDSIMYRLPKFNNYMDLCLDKGLKKILFYGGIALTAYLFYTETLEYLSQGALTKIFNPLKLQSREVKELARQNHDANIDIDNKVSALALQAKKTAHQLSSWTKEVDAKQNLLMHKANELKSIEQTNARGIADLKLLISQIDIPLLTQKVQEIESNCESQQQAILEATAQINYATKLNKEQLRVQVEQAHKKHASRAMVNRTLVGELSDDIDTFFTKVIALANSVYTNRSKINYALELAQKIEKKIEDLEQLSDSGSEASETSDSEDDDNFPRGQGGSK